ncbi:MAG: 4Fe-4S binding protein, partial [Nitrospirota bacterium]|nr:4Fe-4S binding protein [Nitrospirota bacterium]
MGDAAEKKLPNIVINAKFCKGCSICVDFCPTNV